MRLIHLTAAILATTGFALAQEPGAPATPAAEEAAAAPASKQDISYSIGTMIAGNLKSQGIDIDLAELTKGITDTLGGQKPRLDQAAVQKVMMAFQQQQMKAHEEKAAAASGKNKEEGAAFLAKNAKEEGVVTTASGLQYKILKQGDGAKPTATDTVKVHYHGTLLSGKVFDSSVDRGEPISFPLNGVIKGWTEGVQLMPVGSKFKFFIPSDLAYGDNGAGADIGPGATLIFEVELLAIEKK
ncbi:FKBP-type peptidyl-prolyl cis-trans isomerase [Luteolibacter soli]|uniref:Peptidyl-prolyl cis-trans isomerase n=1 Tax=Luteolibacter soli TaxID=3135280 RepID=A0ABU9AU42_9BACT